MGDKRFLLWILLSTLLLVGLLVGKRYIPVNQPEPAADQAKQEKKEEKPQTAEEKARAAEKAKADAKAKAEQKAKDEKQAAEDRRIADEKAAAFEKTHPDIVLGADDPAIKLQAVFSQRGGAITKITLKSRRNASRIFAEREPWALTLVNDDDDGKLWELSAYERVRRQSFRFLVPEVALAWKVRERSANKVVFATEVPDKGVTVIRTFEVHPGEYHLHMQLDFQFAEGAKKDFVYELTGPRGLPIEGAAWPRMPFRQVAVGTVDAKDATVAYRKLVDPTLLKPDAKTKVEPIKPGNEGRRMQYAGVIVQYFGALIVVEGDPTQAGYIDTITPEYLGDDEDLPAAAAKFQGKVGARLTSRPFSENASHNYLVFAGPVKVRLLASEAGVADGLWDRYEDVYHLNLLTDAPSDNIVSRAFAYIGWNAMVVLMTNLMHRLLEFLYLITGHYGVAIIVMTIIVRLLMFPISRKQALASIRMQKLAPELKKLQEKFKDKKEELMRAQWALYKQQGVSPMSGCFVILLQMPVFLGLYYALYESINLRLVSFLWIDNLAAPDGLFNWENIWGLRWLGTALNFGPTFNILPLVSVALMVVQQKWMTPPAVDEQQAMQMKMMNIMMIFMAYMFYWVPAGLCVYFIVSGAWGMVERKLLPKISHTDLKPGADAKAAVGPRGKKPSPNGDRGGPSVLSGLKDWWTELLKKAEKK